MLLIEAKEIQTLRRLRDVEIKWKAVEMQLGMNEKLEQMMKDCKEIK